MQLNDLHRIFSPELTSEGSLVLDKEETRHAKVLRLQEGDALEVMNGKGLLCLAEVQILKPRLTLRVTKVLAKEDRTKTQVTLAVAPTKNINRFEWIVEKATEVGIERIVPILCERSERKYIKVDRLERIALSAAKQSKSLWMTEITEMQSFESLLDESEGERFIAHCVDGMERKSLTAVSSEVNSTLIAIGPEGDFSEAEIKAAMNAGFQGLDLGPKRLRTETAAIVAALAATVFRAEFS